MHVHEQADLDLIRRLARAGKLAGLTVLNNTGFADEMADLVPYVVLRIYGVEQQGFVEYGANNHKVIYQFDNERNIHGDSAYYMEMMQRCPSNRNIVLFDDSVGWTEDYEWRERQAVLEEAKRRGHYVGMHLYGDVTKGDDNYCPMIDLNHPEAFRWFFGRVFHLYSLMPWEAQPNLIATEAGSGGFQRNATSVQWLEDVRRVDAYVKAFHWFKSFNLWTMGGGGAYGFERDKIDDYARQLI